jgi:Flp pilus assembly pilin Flp
MFKKLMNDEAGFVVSSELVLIATILVLGLIVGLTSLRNSITAELADLAAAIGNISQSYSFSAITGHSSSVAGTSFLDAADFCETAIATSGGDNVCISVVENAGTVEQ